MAVAQNSVFFKIRQTANMGWPERSQAAAQRVDSKRWHGFGMDRGLLQLPPLGPALGGTRGQQLRDRSVSQGAMATARSIVSCQVSTQGSGGDAFEPKPTSSSDQRSSPSISSSCQPTGKAETCHLLKKFHSPKAQRKALQLTRAGLITSLTRIPPAIRTLHESVEMRSNAVGVPLPASTAHRQCRYSSPVQPRAFGTAHLIRTSTNEADKALALFIRACFISSTMTLTHFCHFSGTLLLHYS
ncbi:hypothetical protein MHYP_G00072730 [Metynnis hypsauchen]